jgi:hypothetical protein
MGKLLVIYFNKQYGSTMTLLDVLTEYTKTPLVVKTFNFNNFIYGFMVQNSIINFFSETEQLFQMDLSPYSLSKNFTELMQMLDDKYLVSYLLYGSSSNIVDIVGRYGDNSNGGLIIRGLLKRVSWRKGTKLRRPAPQGHLPVTLPAQQLLAVEVQGVPG